MTEIKTKTEIIFTLNDSRQRVLDWFTAIPAKDFFTRHEEEWSPSDNVDHLIRAHKPVTMALKLPRFMLRLMFGKANRPSKSYEVLCEKYVGVLLKGGRAGGTFLPTQESPQENAEERKKKILDRLSKESAKLIVVAEAWDEAALDKYILPHPLIGKLTVREMLYFTIYHNLRHATLEGD